MLTFYDMNDRSECASCTCKTVFVTLTCFFLCDLRELELPESQNEVWILWYKVEVSSRGMNLI